MNTALVGDLQELCQLVDGADDRLIPLKLRVLELELARGVTGDLAHLGEFSKRWYLVPIGTFTL